VLQISFVGLFVFVFGSYYNKCKKTAVYKHTVNGDGPKTAKS